jgi:hypothetical protein
MENENAPRRSSIVRRIGLLCVLVGTGGMAIYGRTPLALFSMVGGIILILDDFRGNTSNFR